MTKSGKSRRIGVHLSTTGGSWTAVDRAVEIGANTFQIFSSSPRMWRASSVKPADAKKMSELRAEHDVGPVAIHASYLINVCSQTETVRGNSVAAFRGEVERALALGAEFLVLHPGAHLGAGVEAGLAKVVESLDAVFAEIPAVKTKVALEITAGQGSCLGCEFEHLAHIINHVRQPERLCVCIDTAHLFAAGYDIRQPKGWDKTMRRFHALIGREQIAAFHLNDSRTELNSRVDRHEHIGKGKIGLEAFRHIVNDSHFRPLPGCLETPKSDDLHEDIENLATLRSLAR